MKLQVVAALAACVAFSGCAVQKVAVPMGGSRSDGTIRLGYRVAMFEKPVVDWNAAEATARQRCAAWGYSDAQAFGGSSSKCVSWDFNGACNTWEVAVEYQCTGQPEAVAQ